MMRAKSSASQSRRDSPPEDNDAAREAYIRLSQQILERDLEKQEKEERMRLLRKRVGTPIALFVITVGASAFLWYWTYVRR